MEKLTVSGFMLLAVSACGGAAQQEPTTPSHHSCPATAEAPCACGATSPEECTCGPTCQCGTAGAASCGGEHGAGHGDEACDCPEGDCSCGDHGAQSSCGHHDEGAPHASCGHHGEAAQGSCGHHAQAPEQHASSCSGHPGAEHRVGQHGHHHDFSDVARYAARFDSAERAAWQRPDEVVQLMSITAGQTVADLGAGTGYFLSRLSAAVGPQGRVHALDVEPAMVSHMQTRAQQESLANVTASVVPVDGPGIPNNSVDRILIVDTWHHFDNRNQYAQKLFAAVRPGGSVFVVDFTMESPEGPPVSARMLPQQVEEELRSAGFVTSVLEESLPHQYVVRATRAAR